MKYHRKLQLVSTLFSIQDNSQKEYAMHKSTNFFITKKNSKLPTLHQRKKLNRLTSKIRRSLFRSRFRAKTKRMSLLRMISTL